LHKYFAGAGLAADGGRVQTVADSQEVAGHLEMGARPLFDVAARRRGEQQPCVILVDDDTATAEMYRLGLEHHGFSVDWVGDGPGLFKSLSLGLPDVVVLDWQLPGMNGDEILLRIRLDERTRALPVLMLSNYPASRDGEIDRVFMAGALAWLEKSNTPPALLAEKLKEVLGV